MRASRSATQQQSDKSGSERCPQHSDNGSERVGCCTKRRHSVTARDSRLTGRLGAALLLRQLSSRRGCRPHASTQRSSLYSSHRNAHLRARLAASDQRRDQRSEQRTARASRGSAAGLAASQSAIAAACACSLRLCAAERVSEWRVRAVNECAERAPIDGCGRSTCQLLS
jgi:hypothetical protein